MCRLDFVRTSIIVDRELAASYWGSILEYSNYTAGSTNGVGAHLAETMASAAKLNGSCPEGYGTLFPCHIAPWGFQSDDQSRYNLFVRLTSKRCDESLPEIAALD